MKKQLLIIGIVVILNTIGSSGCILAENKPPTLYISANPTSGFPPLDVSLQINASDSDGYIKWYMIDFGDGNFSKVNNPIHHTYPKAGTYIFSVTVMDDKNSRASKSITIIVNNPEN